MRTSQFLEDFVFAEQSIATETLFEDRCDQIFECNVRDSFIGVHVDWSQSPSGDGDFTASKSDGEKSERVPEATTSFDLCHSESVSPVSPSMPKYLELPCYEASRGLYIHNISHSEELKQRIRVSVVEISLAQRSHS